MANLVSFLFNDDENKQQTIDLIFNNEFFDTRYLIDHFKEKGYFSNYSNAVESELIELYERFHEFKSGFIMTGHDLRGLKKEQIDKLIQTYFDDMRDKDYVITLIEKMNFFSEYYCNTSTGLDTIWSFAKWTKLNPSIVQKVTDRYDDVKIKTIRKRYVSHNVLDSKISKDNNSDHQLANDVSTMI